MLRQVAKRCQSGHASTWPMHAPLEAAQVSLENTMHIFQTSVSTLQLSLCCFNQPQTRLDGLQPGPWTKTPTLISGQFADLPHGLQKRCIQTARYPSVSLHEAAEVGDLDGLKGGLDNVWMHVDLPDKDGLTPLARAALALQTDAVQLLIANGADLRMCMGKGVYEHAEILTSLAHARKTHRQESTAGHTAMGDKQNVQAGGLAADKHAPTGRQKGEIAQTILAAFPECAVVNNAPTTTLGLGEDNSDLQMCIERTRKFALGPYNPIGDKNPWAQLEFAVDIFLKVNKRTSVDGVVAAIRQAGAKAQVVDKSYAQGAEGKLVPVIGKAAEWKVVQWSKGEWHLIGVNSPIGRGDVHLDHVSAVFNNLKQIAAMDKLWEVNVGLRKAVGCFSLHHLQSLCVRFAMCELGFRSLMPCPARSFHEDESKPVINVLRKPMQATQRAFDDVYNANTLGRLVRLLGDESLLKLNEVESFGIAQFLSAGGAPNFIDLKNWIRILHWFVGTSDLAIPMNTRQNPDDPDDALQFVLTKLVTDPLLVEWARNRRRVETMSRHRRQL